MKTVTLDKGLVYDLRDRLIKTEKEKALRLATLLNREHAGASKDLAALLNMRKALDKRIEREQDKLIRRFKPMTKKLPLTFGKRSYYVGEPDPRVEFGFHPDVPHNGGDIVERQILAVRAAVNDGEGVREAIRRICGVKL